MDKLAACPEVLDTTELWNSEDTQLLKALELLGIQPPGKAMPVPKPLIFKQKLYKSGQISLREPRLLVIFGS